MAVVKYRCDRSDHRPHRRVAEFRCCRAGTRCQVAMRMLRQVKLQPFSSSQPWFPELLLAAAAGASGWLLLLLDQLPMLLLLCENAAGCYCWLELAAVVAGCCWLERAAAADCCRWIELAAAAG